MSDPVVRTPVVADVIAAVERHYPTALAEAWDAVGLVVGSRSAPVTRILYTVDVTWEVVQEAVAAGADLILAHHPLYLRPVHAVDLDHPKGRIVAELVRHDIALYVAHTNADLPPHGTVDTLAGALGLLDPRPLRPHAAGPRIGLGRIGGWPTEGTLEEFVAHVGGVLPTTGGGIRWSGDPNRVIRRVAVQAGAGDDLLEEARLAGADVYVTSDLRHHPASEARAWPNAPALVDVPHWAAESLWLPVACELLTEDLHRHGFGLAATVSEVCTDPWNAHG